MKAVQFDSYGGPEVLQYRDVADPVPGAGQVRLRVAGSAFNPLDAGIRGGWVAAAFPVTFPHTPGYDVAGTIDRLGDGVHHFQVGDPVVAFLAMTEGGGAAQYVVVTADQLVRAPRNLALADAAALPSVGTTAWQVLFDAAGLQAGQRVLINGAGGAVGRVAVQLAVHAGAVVVATTSPDKAESLLALGAGEVIDHTAGPVVTSAPVDALVNLGPVAAEALAAMVASVREGGVVVNTVPAVATPAEEARGVGGVSFFVHSDIDDLGKLVQLVDAGVLQVLVDERVALEDLASVHARADAGALRGKVVVLPPAL